MSKAYIFVDEKKYPILIHTENHGSSGGEYKETKVINKKIITYSGKIFYFTSDDPEINEYLNKFLGWDGYCSLNGYEFKYNGKPIFPTWLSRGKQCKYRILYCDSFHLEDFPNYPDDLFIPKFK